VFRRRRKDGENEPASEADEYQPDEDDLAEPEEASYDAGEPEESGDFGDGDFDDGDSGQQPARTRAKRDDLSDPVTWTRLRDSAPAGPAVERSTGPWDSAAGYPEGERVDFGSLLVPVRDGCDVQVFVSDEVGVSIAVVRGESGLQLQPFAAPRSGGLWEEVIPEIAEEVASAGGTSEEQDGPFGRELLATVSPPVEEGQQLPPQPIRFMGADGPRWFLRGLISGPAATDTELARPLEEVFADVVVVRGDFAVPPRQPLDVLLPEEARQVLEGQMEEAENPNLLNPFERGPEITETR
jgi:hypothetical protein